MSEIIYASAKSMARAIAEKEVSAVEVVEAHLARIEEVNPALNAVVMLAADRARAEAADADAALARGESKGALHGVPFTLKDSIDTEGVVTTGGTMGRKDFVPDADATVAARLRAAGGILLGKTNTPELTYAGETDNLIYGRTNNPFDLSRAPGGSSGGAGAIVCCGGAAFDIGSDTGGSIRGPAHYCGITGIKPNSGRVPRTGHIVPHSFGAVDSLTQNGPMARYVEDLALIMPIISGPDWSDPFIPPVPLGDPADVDISGLRVCFYTDNGVRTPTAEIMAAVRAAVAALDDVCASVEEDLPRVIAENPEIAEMLRQGDGQAGAQRLLAKYGTTETHEWMTRQLEKSSERAVFRWRVHGGTGTGGRLPQRYARLHAELRCHYMSGVIVCSPPARPVYDGRVPLRHELYWYLQHHGLALDRGARRHFAGRSAHRRAGGGASVARGCVACGGAVS